MTESLVRQVGYCGRPAVFLIRRLSVLSIRVDFARYIAVFALEFQSRRRCCRGAPEYYGVYEDEEVDGGCCGCCTVSGAVS